MANVIIIAVLVISALNILVFLVGLVLAIRSRRIELKKNELNEAEKY